MIERVLLAAPIKTSKRFGVMCGTGKSAIWTSAGAFTRIAKPGSSPSKIEKLSPSVVVSVNKKLTDQQDQ